MIRYKNASFTSVNAGRSVPNSFLFVIGIFSVAVSLAEAQEPFAPDALPVNTVIGTVTIGGYNTEGIVVSPDSNTSTQQIRILAVSPLSTLGPTQ